MDDDADGGFSDQEGEDADFFAVGEGEEDEEELLVRADRVDVKASALAADVFFYKDGSPVEECLSYPKIPDGFESVAPKVTKGEPTNFDEVDNPGGWNSYFYKPK